MIGKDNKLNEAAVRRTGGGQSCMQNDVCEFIDYQPLALPSYSCNMSKSRSPQ